MYPRLVVRESNKDYVVAQRGGGWTCGCPMSMFKKKKCRHIFFVEANNLGASTQTSTEAIPYDPSLGDCGNKYVQAYFNPEEWTDPDLALAYMYMREGELAGTEKPKETRKDWKKELDALRKRAPKKRGKNAL